MDGARTYDHPSDVYFCFLLRFLLRPHPAPPAAPAAAVRWVEMLDDGGRPYFYSFASGAAQTDPPPPEEVATASGPPPAREARPAVYGWCMGGVWAVYSVWAGAAEAGPCDGMEA